MQSMPYRTQPTKTSRLDWCVVRKREKERLYNLGRGCQVVVGGGFVGEGGNQPTVSHIVSAIIKQNPLQPTTQAYLYVVLCAPRSYHPAELERRRGWHHRASRPKCRA